jgi:hypothetical protein
MSPRPSWGNPIPQQPEQEERSYPERYIFLVLFFIVFARLLKAIRQYRPQEQFDAALDDLDVEASTEMEGEPRVVPRYDAGLYWDDSDVTGLSVATSPGGTYHVNGRSSDDAYQAGVSTLSRETPSLPTENLNAHRVQHLLTKLRAASYAARNEGEGSPGRQTVEMLRRQIAEIIMMGRFGLDYASLPPPEIMDPPPAYSDVVQAHENLEPPPITTCPT